jgi:hypothetical protein
MNLGRHLHLEHIRSNFNQLDVGIGLVAGTIKVKGTLSGETKWMNVSQEKMVLIRAIMMLDAEQVSDLLVDHIAYEYPYTLDGVDTQC